MPNALTISLGSVDITTSVDMSTVVMQLAGSQETATCEFDIIDTANTVGAGDEYPLTVTEVSSATVLFGGLVRSRRISVLATGRVIHIMAVDYNSMLERRIVISDKRAAGESDKARLTYLLQTYTAGDLSTDVSQIATLNASMPAQKFVAITLRQAIERVLGQASTKSSYFIDPTGRLHTYDRTIVTAAPYNVRVGTPGGGELAPESFEVDNDASNLVNAVYIVGATAAGSGWFTDPTSIFNYGRRERFFNAPDSDTAAKASQVGLAVLADQKNPIPRGVFTTKSPYDGWRIGQSITVNSTQHGLTNQSYRIARVTVHYLSGAGDREYSIELGAPQVSMPALLSAAHGGGGGYPWYSPGGSGVWGPILGSGTTGTGLSGGGNCACNTPFVSLVFDDFNNRTRASGWGPASPGPGTWSDYNSALVSVAGGLGTLAPVIGGAAAQETVSLAGVSVAWPATAWMRFRINRRPTDIGTNTNEQNVFAELLFAETFAPRPTPNEVRIALGHYKVGASYSTQVIATSVNASGTVTESTSTADFDPTPGTWYEIKALFNPGDAIQYKLWASGSAEPGWHTPVGVSMDNGGWNPNFFETVTANPLPHVGDVNWNLIQDVDWIALNSNIPASGTPYPKTYLRNGDGFTTTFTPLTNYRTGSLLVYVDNVVQSTIAEDGITFSLGFAPTSSQKVSASWTVA